MLVDDTFFREFCIRYFGGSLTPVRATDLLVARAIVRPLFSRWGPALVRPDPLVDVSAPILDGKYPYGNIEWPPLVLPDPLVDVSASRFGGKTRAGTSRGRHFPTAQAFPC